MRLCVGMIVVSGIQRRGILALTDQRVIFIDAGLVLSQQIAVPLDSVTGVAIAKGLLYSNLKTTGPQANVSVRRIDKADAAAFASDLRTLLTSRAKTILDTSSGTSSDVASQLERLVVLRDQGNLTSAEYELQKRRLLATN